MQVQVILPVVTTVREENMNWRKLLTRRRGFVGPLKKKANTIPSMSHILVTFLGRFQGIFFSRE